ncbi:stealth family protein [Streptomyces xanthochromogenes]|uniref:stealth family protein n=1 Tax=Streptomyces xanthochromogenes TaxID=67384 RepID=UPI00342037F5
MTQAQGAPTAQEARAETAPGEHLAGAALGGNDRGGSTAHNAESSGLVSLYRKALPATGRRAIARRFSPEQRRRVKQQLTAASAGLQATHLRATTFSATHRALISASGAVVVTIAGRSRLALPQPRVSPETARRANLATVTETLSAAGIDYFCIRRQDRSATTVALARADRAAALKTLSRHCASHPAYLTAPDGGGRAHAGFRPASWQRYAHADVVRLFAYHTDPGQHVVLGPEHGCDLEFWAEDGERLVAPRRNSIAESVPGAGSSVEVPAETFTAPYGTRDAGVMTVRTREEFTTVLPRDITFPVDAVFTWVDGSDPAWLERRSRFSGTSYHAEAANAARYADHDELRYSLRSLDMYAPWIRTIYLVTDDQTPAWLDTSVPGIQVVSHRDIFRDTSVLPTFNSHAIESQLHHIDGLSEHFLYFNDDVFLGSELSPKDFFLANGLTRFFPSPALVPLGPPSAADVPVAAAGKNNRALILERFGTTPVEKMRHTPHALTRSVLDEIEAEFAEQHTTTASHRFRSSDDIAIPSSLHHYHAFHTRRAVPGDLRYVYVDVAHPHTPNHLDRLLLKRDKQVFCINDTTSDEADFARSDRLIRTFLGSYFPIPSRFERPL